jgi:glutathione S-transferase
MSAEPKGLKLWYAPNTRCFRVIWLLEELGLPYQLERVTFIPPANTFFQQKTPTGKFPTLEDGDVVICESGAITEYIQEKYGDGRLAPPVGSPDRARYLQWLHFADSTAFPPMGILVWLLLYREDATENENLITDAQHRAAVGLEFLERELGENTWLLGDEFSAADIMVGFTLAAAQRLGLLKVQYPRIKAYFDRLQRRPACVAAMAIENS